MSKKSGLRRLWSSTGILHLVSSLWVTAALAAQPSWGPASRLNGNVIATGGSVAVDDLGRAESVWGVYPTNNTMDYVQAATRPAPGPWQRPQKLPTHPAVAFVGLPVVHSNAAGALTAVWADKTAIWSADKPVNGGKWSTPRQIGPSPSRIVFTMNRNGDALVTWEVTVSATENAIQDVIRPTGGTWSMPQTVVPQGLIYVDDAAVGLTGVAAVAWESYDRSNSNVVQHVSSAASLGAAWQDSGGLFGPDNQLHAGLVTVDASGKAGLVVSFSDVNTAQYSVVARTEPSPGASWTAPVVIATQVSPDSALRTDDAGHATVLVQDALVGRKLFAVQGDLGSNTWSQPVALVVDNAMGSSVMEGGLDIAANGNAVAAVRLGSIEAAMVSASVRNGSAGSWSQAVVLPGQPTRAKEYLAGVAINPAGQAFVTWDVFSGYFVYANSLK